MKTEYIERIKPLDKKPTGIKGFDGVLDGGLPAGRFAMVTGETGTGKTVLLNEFIYRGITELGENGVFVSFEENSKDIIKNMGAFGWDYPQLIGQKKLYFIDAITPEDITIEIGRNYDFSPFLLRVRRAIKEVNARRLVIDNLNAFFMRFSNKTEIRATLNLLLSQLKEEGVTGIISVEKGAKESELSSASAEFVADTIIELSKVHDQMKTVRELTINKMRGSGYHSGIMEFEINSAGFQVFPKISMNLTIAATDFNVRKKFGVPVLDEEILDGGIPEGQSVVVSGNTGTGKSIMGLQFIHSGLKAGEPGLYLGLEESVEELKKIAKGLGWDFEQDQKNGTLAFLTASMIDLQADKLLAEIIYTVEKYHIKRMVFDSASSLMAAARMSTGRTRDFIIQLGGFLKMKGITALFTFMMPQNFGAPKGLLLSGIEVTRIQVSSLVDGVVVLMFVERDYKIKKVLTILKMRGVNHSKHIYEYGIGKGGIVIEGKYGVGQNDED